LEFFPLPKNVSTFRVFSVFALASSYFLLSLFALFFFFFFFFFFVVVVVALISSDLKPLQTTDPASRGSPVKEGAAGASTDAPPPGKGCVLQGRWRTEAELSRLSAPVLSMELMKVKDDVGDLMSRPMRPKRQLVSSLVNNSFTSRFNPGTASRKRRPQQLRFIEIARDARKEEQAAAQRKKEAERAERNRIEVACDAYKKMMEARSNW